MSLAPADPELDHAVFSVEDYLSRMRIMGLHAFSDRVRWPPSEERLFVDPTPIYTGGLRILWEPPAPLAVHSPDPSPEQAFSFGVHRAFKAFQPDRDTLNLGQAQYQWKLLRNIWRHCVDAGERRAGLAVLGADLVVARGDPAGRGVQVAARRAEVPRGRRPRRRGDPATPRAVGHAGSTVGRVVALARPARGARAAREAGSVNVRQLLLGNRYVVGRGVVLVSGTLGTWCATQILDRDQYGHAILAVQVAFFVGAVTPFGLDSLVLFRGAEARAASGARALITAAFSRVLAASCLAALVGAAGLFVARAWIPPGQVWWLFAALPLIPLFALNQLCAAFALGQDRVTASLLIPRLGDALRAAVLVLGFLLLPTMPAVFIAAYLVGASVPVLTWAAVLRPWGASTPLTGEDWVYARRLAGATVAQQSLRKIDVIMLGMLATGGTVGDYAIGAQFAVLVAVGDELLTPALIPRFAELVAKKDLAGAGSEYTNVQAVTVSAAILSTLVLLAVRPLFMVAFPEHPGAFDVLLILSAALSAKLGFGATGRALALLGLSTISLWTNIALLILVVLLNLLLIPLFGAQGAALGTFVAFFMINLVKYVAIRRYGGVSLSTSVPLCLTVACVALLLFAFRVVPAVPTASVLLGSVAVIVALNRAAILDVIRRVRARLRRGSATEKDA